MAAFLIPIAGLALGALGRLMQRRRQQRALQGAQGAAFGSAINTQSQGPPTNAVSQAATTSPTPPQERRRTAGAREAEQQREDADMRARAQYQRDQRGPGTTPPQTRDTMLPKPTPSNEGLAARMGRGSVTRARKRNLQQQATLGMAATTR